MAIRKPFNLNQWITDNRDLLKPPVGNKNLYADAGDYIVMIVGGPNARKDYHRITSYNVCYTKLLRSVFHLIAARFILQSSSQNLE